MENKMLIEATHPEETRVVVVRGNRVEEFDFEAANKKQLKGNIYLAKVTRVEPSLQAAFVDYGGNRHGFLAFSEIHPDYYQIPVADRQALLEAEAEAHKAEEDEEEEKPKRKPRRRRTTKSTKAVAADTDDVVQSEPVEQEDEAVKTEEASTDDASESEKDSGDEAQAADAVSADEPAAEIQEEPVETEQEVEPEADTEVTAKTDEGASKETSNDDDASEATAETSDDQDSEKAGDEIEAAKSDDSDSDDADDEDSDNSEEDEDVESVGSEDALEEVPERRSRPRVKQYKIQEVIKRRQIILVQVVKEERGNKGAALTTYLSLAGRYSVLMPNTDRGGGISRKITNQTDRKRLRTIASDLDVAEGMGVILRTAGASRTKTEIKRDFEYLMRLWENVRDLTLKSSAPTLVYEEGSLLKRSIRDLYNKDIKQVMVAGETGYREAKDFMRMLMPSHAKNVQPYKDPQPIFARYGVEAQLDAMFSPQVTLKSGGYIVINQTEALVSIDVNSGRSTRENSIEDTALSTNLEAAEEVARQLRLRDLAGLVVIDFIDMEEKRNNRAVERKMKECLRDDRARIQVGRISHFGLLEMSRQRLRAGVLESTMEVCPHCEGTGYVRAPASISLHVLRAIEDQLLKGSKYNLIVKTRTAVALYVLNHKRAHLMELEDRFGLQITLEADETIVGEYYTINRGDRAEAPKTPPSVTPNTVDIDVELARDAELDAEAEAKEKELIAREEDDDQEDDRPAKKRRRRRRGRRSDSDMETAGENADGDAADSDDEESADGVEASSDEQEGRKKRRRRGRRGGKRERERKAKAQEGNEENIDGDAVSAESQEEVSSLETPEVEAEVATSGEAVSETAPVEGSTEKAPEAKLPEPDAVETNGEAPVEAKADAGHANDEASEEEVTIKAEPEPAPVIEEEKPAKPAKSGWWQRRSFF